MAGDVRATSLVLRRLQQRDGTAAAAPESASARRYLRDGLPAVYREGDFGMRFVGALERSLDPIVALLDSLAAHFDPELATAPMLDLVAAWLGVEVDESWPVEQRRELLRRAGDLGPRRGTLRGLELLLSIALPGLPFRVEDGGRVAYATDPEALPAPDPPGFVVYCDVPVDDEQAARIVRLIEQARPVGVAYRLRVRRAASKDKGSGE